MKEESIDYSENLTNRIQSLIEGYDPKSLLKEFLQNADDSGATELIVAFDKRHFDSLEKKHQKAQGPALIISNNSEFSEQDFTNIYNISNRGKVLDSSSTGRFGQGFSSSFSVSDHPSFYSSNRFTWFDVLHSAVCKNESKHIKCWTIDNNFPSENKWIKSFLKPSDENSFFIKRSIFRLPLRTSERYENEISEEKFTYNDFTEWIEEWSNHPEKLLFLRNINTLTLIEINESGQQTELLNISTKNQVEVAKSKEKINVELNGTTLGICQKWLSEKKELPIEKYKHTLEIICHKKHGSISYTKNWAVINGLYRGENNKLIHKAVEVLNIKPNPRKVLPWVGVALPLDESHSESFHGTYFSFLPIKENPNKSCIHGWFDLDDKRTEITSNKGTADATSLSEWNELLCEQAIGPAYSEILEFIKYRVKTNIYYSFWPILESSVIEQHICKGFYQTIKYKKCIKVIYKNKSSWERPSEKIFTLNKINESKLRDFTSEIFMITSTKLNEKVIEKLKKLYNYFTEISPNILSRELIRLTGNTLFPTNFSSFDTLPFKGDIEKLYEVSKFCLKSRDHYRLPIELLSNGQLKCIDKITLIDDKINIEKFYHKHNLVLNSDYFKKFDHTNDTLPVEWVTPNLKNKLLAIKLVMSRDPSYSMNNDFLLFILKTINKSNQVDILESFDVIQDLPIIKYIDDTYLTPRHKKHHLMVNNIDEFYDLLSRLNVNLIDKEHLNHYKKIHQSLGCLSFFKAIDHNYIIENMYNHCSEFEAANYQSKNKHIHLILNLINENINNHCSQNLFDKLKKLPLVKDTQGIYRCLNDEKIYLPSNFSAPKFEGVKPEEIELISCEYEQYNKLFLSLKVRELNFETYIKDVVAPKFLDKEINEEKLYLIDWLATEYNDRSSAQNLIKEFFHKKFIVPNLEGELSLAEKTYSSQFNIFNGIYKDLISKKYLISIPENFNIESINIMFDELGAKNVLLKEHISEQLELISNQKDTKKANLFFDFFINFEHLFSHFKKEDFETLSNYAWIPSIRRQKKEQAIERDFLFSKGRNSISNKMSPILGLSFNVISFDIGVEPTDRFFEVFCVKNDYSFDEHFSNIKKIIGATECEDNHIHEAMLSFYQACALEKIDIGHFNENIIYCKNNWLNVNEVFINKSKLNNVKSIESIFNSIDSSEKKKAVKKGLTKLGVKVKPDIKFIEKYLNNLGLNKSLTKVELEECYNLYNYIERNLSSDINQSSNIPLLNKESILLNKNDIFIDDLTAYENSTTKNYDINFCSNHFHGLAAKLGVKSLARNTCKTIDKGNFIFIEKENLPRECYEIEEKVKSKWFKESLIRILNHHNNTTDETPIDFDNEISWVKELTIKHSIDGTWIFNEDNVKSFEDDNILYLIESKKQNKIINIVADFIVEKININDKNIANILRELLSDADNLKSAGSILDDESIAKNKKPHKELATDQLFFSDSENSDLSMLESGDSLSSKKINKVTNNEKKAKEQTLYKKENTQPTLDFKKIAQINIAKVNQNREHRELKLQDLTNPSSIKKRTPPLKSSKNTGYDFLPDVKKTGKITANAKDIVSQNNRDGRERYFDGNQSSEIGTGGEILIYENQRDFILSSSNKIEKMPENNAGYDLREVDKNGNIIRFIEVKTLTGQWGVSGVKVSKTQKNFSDKNSNWWLFVVEHFNSETPKVYLIEAPFKKINSYYFDYNWAFGEAESVEVQKVT